MTILAEIGIEPTEKSARPPWRVQAVTDRLEEHLLTMRRITALRQDANDLVRREPSEQVRAFAHEVVLLADRELIRLARLIGGERAELADSGVLTCVLCGTATDGVEAVTVPPAGSVRPVCRECRLNPPRRAS